MKKILKPVAAFAGLLLVLAACNKNENDLMPEHTANDPTTEKILAFKAKLGQADKIDETMSIDSAVWYIEAALNYTHCIVSEEDANKNIDNKHIDSVYFSYNRNDRISYTELNNLYSLFENEMLDVIASVNADVKYPYLADVKYKANQFILIYTINIGNTDKGIGYTITDDWTWGYGFGNCSGTVQYRDAADEIQTWLNANRPVRPGIYYTEITAAPGMFATLTDPYWANIWENDPNGGGNRHNLDIFPWMFNYQYSNPNLPYPHVYPYCIDAQTLNNQAAATNNVLDIAEANYTYEGYEICNWYVHYECYGMNQGYPENIMFHSITAYQGLPHIEGSQTE